jgi:hypothetical protein
MQSQQFNEILIEQRRKELDRLSPHKIEAMNERRAHEGFRRAVASAFVRIGMTLDHDAGVREALAR